MLKNKNFALGTAALLLSTAGFTACSSDDTFTGSSLSGEAVKTQFAINIPTPGVNGRMTAENTQQSGNFLGMHNIKLIPMTTQGAAGQTFSSILSLDAINTGDFGTTANTKVYSDVNIPVNTTNFLFYGAGSTADPSSADEKFQKGVLTQNVAGNSTSDITFSLQAAKGEDTNGEAGKLLKVLNEVDDVLSAAQSNGEIATIYGNFKKLTAGSANSIFQTLVTLYNSVKAIDGQETVAEGIKNAMIADGTFTYADGTGLTAHVTYPENINMPDGAAVLSYIPGDDPFSYVDGTSTGTGMSLKMSDVCFPASIYYFANTALKASDSDHSTDTWPTTAQWSTSSFFDQWGSTVLPTTRSIALADPIQYGVARLALTAKCEGKSLQDQDGTQVSVPADGYEITGVLIGGQPDEAGWDLTPKTSGFTKVVYDNKMNNTVTAKADASNGTNYTIVLDNYQQTTPNKVNIAVEFKNTGADFYGVNGVVPAGAKFYLVAQLDPANYQGQISGVTTPYVFMKGYTTTANLKIKSLANAYNTIPDLRASELSLGLTVDLTWKTGINLDVDIN